MSELVLILFGKLWKYEWNKDFSGNINNSKGLYSLVEDTATIVVKNLDIYKKEGEKGFSKVPGVGRGIAAHIRAIFEKKDFPEHTKLKKKYPVDVLGLTAIDGVGPKMVKALWQKLKIRSVADLEHAARKGKIRGIEHFGEKTEEKILKGISKVSKIFSKFL